MRFAYFVYDGVWPRLPIRHAAHSARLFPIFYPCAYRLAALLFLSVCLIGKRTDNFVDPVERTENGEFADILVRQGTLSRIFGKSTNLFDEQPAGQVLFLDQYRRVAVGKHLSVFILVVIGHVGRRDDDRRFA